MAAARHFISRSIKASGKFSDYASISRADSRGEGRVIDNANFSRRYADRSGQRQASAPLLARYPLPNDPHGAYGARTVATSSKVVTRTDQASLRLDHRFSDKTALFLRFSRNQVTGPITNPIRPR